MLRGLIFMFLIFALLDIGSAVIVRVLPQWLDDSVPPVSWTADGLADGRAHGHVGGVAAADAGKDAHGRR